MVRGIAPYFAVTGLFAVPLLIGAGFLGPRLGVGLYLSSVIAGQLICSVVIDHFGAFGIPAHHFDLARAAGIGALVIGVVLIRGIHG
jgi:bacterial/archaeal transporter family-2 protein